jgi:hypothetical protein
MSPTVFAAIYGKAGLAGGTLRVSAVLDRPLNDKTVIAGEAGYGFGNNYTIVSAAATGKYLVRENLNLGAIISYSSYSTAASNILGVGSSASGGGMGGGVFAEFKLREGIYGQLGYDNRLGVIAEASYYLRK